MSARPGSIDRLRSFLDGLPSSRRLDLLKQVALSGGRGRSSAELALVLEALRPSLEKDLRAESGLQFARLVFFRPCEPFIVDDRGSAKHRGFIHRSTLDGVWRWLNYRTECANWPDRTERAIEAFLSGDNIEADALVIGMRADTAAAIHEDMDAASRSDIYRQKLTQQVGGPQSFADLPDVAEIFERELDLERLGAHVAGYLGGETTALDRNAISELVAVLAAQDEPLGLPLVRILKELSDPTDLIRLLTTAEGTDDGARLANSRLAGCVDVLLSDLDFTAVRIDKMIGATDQLDRLRGELVRFHRIARGLGAAVDLDRAPAWRTTLGDRRRWVAASLTAAVNEAPDTIARALRPPRNDRQQAPAPDQTQRAVYLAKLLAAVRPLRSELAVNGVVMQAVGKIETFLKTLETALRLDSKPLSAMSPVERERREAFEAVAVALTGRDAAAEEEAQDAGVHAEAV